MFLIFKNTFACHRRLPPAAHFIVATATKTVATFVALLSQETKPRIRKPIGPLRRNDKSLAVEDNEKTNLLNDLFSSIGEKLAAEHAVPFIPSSGACPRPQISEIKLCNNDIKEKINSLSVNKAAGPDGVSPKLLKFSEADRKSVV